MVLRVLLPALGRCCSAAGSVFHYRISSMQQMRGECHARRTMQLGNTTLQHYPQLVAADVKDRDQHSHNGTAVETGALPTQLPHPDLVVLKARPPGWSILRSTCVTHMSSLSGSGLEAVSWTFKTVAGTILAQQRYRASSRPSPSHSSRASARASDQQRKALGLKVLKPQQLTERTKQCSTVHQLQELVRQYSSIMNHISLAAAFKQLGVLDKQLGSTTGDTCLTLDKLWELTQPQLGSLDTRALSGIIWAVGQLQDSSGTAADQHGAATDSRYDTMAMECLLPAFMQQLSAANAQDVSMVMYSVANAGQHLSAEQVQQLLAQLMHSAGGAHPQAIKDTLWAVATMGHRAPAELLQRLVLAFSNKVQQASPQHISITLWALATLGQQVPAPQVQQLVDALVRKLQQVKPQHVSNTLWAVATMGQQLPPPQVQQLVDALVTKLHLATPQNVSNMLWAVATMRQQLLPKQLLRLEQTLVGVLPGATLQNLTNAVWACAKQRYLPEQLLSTPLFGSRLAAAQPQGLSNIAWALAQLGHRDEKIMPSILQQAQHWNVSGAASSSSIAGISQAICNVCWSIAVLDLQQHVPVLCQLAASLTTHWSSLSLAPEALLQLYQVHTWLQDFQLGGVQGLQGILTEQRLQQCREAWMTSHEVRRRQSVTGFQQSLYSAVLQLPIQWSELPAMEQLSRGRDGQEDGALLIDITARTAEGVLLAIEADGPHHFRQQPDGAFMGPTQYRNRALAVRGYTVVGVPWFAWPQLKGSKRQQQFLMQLIKQAVQQQLHARGHPFLGPL